MELPKLTKNGLLNINKINVWLLIMWHIPDFMFQIARKKKDRILLGQGSDGQGQSTHLLITQPGNCFRRYCIANMRRSFILLPPHAIPIDIVNMKVSLYNVVTYDLEILSRVEISFNKVWAKNN